MSTLMDRALMIRTKHRLNKEIRHIEELLLHNGYPKNVSIQIAEKIAHFFIAKRFGPEKCAVYLRVPWIDKLSENLNLEIKTAVKSCYGSVSIRLVFTSKPMLPVDCNDIPPTTQKSFAI